jgi:hypothetical protein
MVKGGKRGGEGFTERSNSRWEGLGVELDKRLYWSGWVLKFGKFIAPLPFYKAAQGDVEAFYMSLAGENKMYWQVEQADAVLKGLLGGP